MIRVVMIKKYKNKIKKKPTQICLTVNNMEQVSFAFCQEILHCLKLKLKRLDFKASLQIKIFNGSKVYQSLSLAVKG